MLHGQLLRRSTVSQIWWLILGIPLQFYHFASYCRSAQRSTHTFMTFSSFNRSEWSEMTQWGDVARFMGCEEASEPLRKCFLWFLSFTHAVGRPTYAWHWPRRWMVVKYITQENFQSILSPWWWHWRVPRLRELSRALSYLIWKNRSRNSLDAWSRRKVRGIRPEYSKFKQRCTNFRKAFCGRGRWILEGLRRLNGSEN